MKKETKLKTPDDYARQFKLHHCIGNRKFAEQIQLVQKEAMEAEREKIKQK